MHTSKYPLSRLITALVAAGAITMVVGCSSSSSSSTPPPQSVGVTLSGVVVDPYIVGATVTAQGNGATTTTTANGTFKFDSTQGTAAELGSFVITGGTDSVTGKPLKGVMKAPAGSGTGAVSVTPLTSLIQSQIEEDIAVATAANGGTPPTAAEIATINSGAQGKIKTALGITDTIDLLTYDPIAEVQKTGAATSDVTLAAKIQQISTQVATVIEMTTTSIASATDNSANDRAGVTTSVSGSAYAGLIKKMAATATTATPTIDFTDTATIGDIIDNTVTDVETKAAADTTGAGVTINKTAITASKTKVQTAVITSTTIIKSVNVTLAVDAATALASLTDMAKKQVASVDSVKKVAQQIEADDAIDDAKVELANLDPTDAAIADKKAAALAKLADDLALVATAADTAVVDTTAVTAAITTAADALIAVDTSAGTDAATVNTAITTAASTDAALSAELTSAVAVDVAAPTAAEITAAEASVTITDAGFTAAVPDVVDVLCKDGKTYVAPDKTDTCPTVTTGTTQG